MKTFVGLLKELPDNGIYVFFSNIKGYHDKGPAKIAHELFGAIWGKPFHTMGRSYGICIRFEATDKIEKRFMVSQIDTFYRIARRDKDKLFYVMCNGTTTLGNYTPEELAEVFQSKPIPNNIVFEDSFADIVYKRKKSSYELESEV